MEFGPLSEVDVGIIREALKKHGSDCIVRVSQEHIDAINEQRRTAPVDPYPSFQGPDLVLFAEIKIKDLLIVRGLLEQMGHKVGSHDVKEIVEVPEYLCPHCKFVGVKQGFCPKHKTPLLEFSEWAEVRQERSKATEKIYVIAVILIAIFLYAAFSWEGWFGPESGLPKLNHRPSFLN